MSHRALIAERQRNDRFNVYHSRNGAEQIQLLDKLREALNVHGRIDWESLNGTSQPETAQLMESTVGPQHAVWSNDSGNVVEPRPLAVGAREEELLVKKDILAYEVLYVVDDGAVDAYWLAWAYPDVIRPWHDHLEVAVYNAGVLPDDPDEVKAFLEDGEPERTISEFERGWLTDDLVREVVGKYHRWIYELQMMTRAADDGPEQSDLGDVPQALQTPEYTLIFRSDTSNPLVSTPIPFMIPIRIESPPNASSERIRGAAAQTRFSIGAGLNAADGPSSDELSQAYADAMMEIVDTHVDRVATEFIPGQLGELIETYQQTREWQELHEVWKN